MSKTLSTVKLIHAELVKSLEEPMQVLVNRFMKTLYPSITSMDIIDRSSLEGMIYSAIQVICYNKVTDIQDVLIVGLEEDIRNGADVPDEVLEAMDVVKASSPIKLNGQGGDA